MGSKKKEYHTVGRTGKTVGRFVRRYWSKLTDHKIPRYKRVLYAGAGFLSLLSAAVVAVGIYFILLIPFTPGLGELESIKNARPTIVLDENGEEITRFQRINRILVELDDISHHVIDALIATEDHRFYEHNGVDVRRLFSAVGHTLIGKRQGGSTITMQLARNLYPEKIGRAGTLTRKLKEIITAYKIEQVFTKEEILETYLNTIPYVYNAVGIELGARTYFSKSAEDLNLSESAVLVGLLKGTSYYNPVRHPERAQQRRNVVLRQMVKRGMLTEEDYLAAAQEQIALDFERQIFRGSRAPHFTEYVRELASQWAKAFDLDLLTDGLVIHTTLNLELQEIARKALQRQLDALQAVVDVEWSSSTLQPASSNTDAYVSRRQKVKPFDHFWQSRRELVDEYIRNTERYRAGIAAGTDETEMLEKLRIDEAFMDSLRSAKTRLEAGFVGIDPRNGHVKAWVGSREYVKGPFDHVIDSKRQPGSTFKPFVYAAALEEGYQPDDRFRDRAVEISTGSGQIWRPKNASGFTGEEMTLRDGLALSKNTITAQLVERVGPGRVAKLAHKMGVNKSELDVVPSLALGTSAVTLLEMVSAYSTIASGGRYREPVVITRIDDNEGNILATFEPRTHSALTKENALTLLDMMRGVVDYGTGQRIRSTFGIRADVAGKTGTTQDNADGWFILMHPELVGGAWVGFNDQRITFRSDYWGQGAHNALFVVGDTYRQAIREGALRNGIEFPRTPYQAFKLNDKKFFTDNFGRWIERALDGIEKAIFGNDNRRNRNRREEEEWEREWREAERELAEDLRELEREAREEAIEALEKMRERMKEKREEEQERWRERLEEARERTREQQERERERDRRRREERERGARVGW